ncbi:type IX secretion system protein PorQ [Luteibaculum oceani]|uniref:Type IX secretion system protein PorQ n=1 Tax=Luteibaculum oceani TaxID=1294296 RepID=A0A5C6UUE9_9FLAO|nr:type IX secretion system protein PorQ [Luteibaculum oceani]TXC76947.1 type IX secretion system protein PorQ [Luteibaculum oceani]
MRNFLVVIALVLSSLFVLGQQKTEAFSNVNFPINARTAALGGKIVAADFSDPQMASAAPQLISGMEKGSVNFQTLFLPNGLKSTDASYLFKVKDLPFTFLAGARLFSFGPMDQTDEFGNVNGNFTPRDQVLYVSAGYNRPGPWQYGASLKFLNSTYEVYTANALAMDLGVAYVDTVKQFSAGAQLSNAGIMLSNYLDARQKLPVNFAMGISKKLDKAPFRFLFTMDNLQQWEIELPEDTEVKRDPLTGEDLPPEEKSSMGRFFRNFTRHIYAGSEIVFSQNFQIRVGYNYLRRKELSIAEKPGTVGLSWGLGFKINRFHIHYANSRFHLAGGAHFFSVTTNINNFWTRKQL